MNTETQIVKTLRYSAVKPRLMVLERKAEALAAAYGATAVHRSAPKLVATKSRRPAWDVTFTIDLPDVKP